MNETLVATVGSLVGQPVSVLDTPALLVDLDVVEANIARIAGECRKNGVSWRPHIKGNKTIEIVRKELAAGAIGITCAKLGEAEVMADAGIAQHPDRQRNRRRTEDRAAGRAARPRRGNGRRRFGGELRADRRGRTPRRQGRASGDRGQCRHEPCRRCTRRARGCAGGRRRENAWRAAGRADGVGEPGRCHRRSRREGTRGARCDRAARPAAPRRAARPAIASTWSVAAAAAPFRIAPFSLASRKSRRAARSSATCFIARSTTSISRQALLLLASVTSRPTPTPHHPGCRQEVDEQRRRGARSPWIAAGDSR